MENPKKEFLLTRKSFQYREKILKNEAQSQVRIFMFSRAETFFQRPLEKFSTVTLQDHRKTAHFECLYDA